MKYIIKAEEKEKVMMEIRKQIDVTKLFPQTTEKQKQSNPNYQLNI